MKVTLSIVNDSATPALRGIRDRALNRTALHRAASRSMFPLIQRSLLNMASSNRNLFGVSAGFWEKMIAGTHEGADNESGWVAMPRPVALRYFGGTVTPKVSSLLAIPARSEAYNKSPRDFSDLRLAVLGKRPDGSLSLALVQTMQQKIGYRKLKGGGVKVTKRQIKGGLVYYWLVPEATIGANPEVLPDPFVLGEAAEQGVIDYLGIVRARVA